MPKILDNVIVGVVANPTTKTVTLTWRNGETTVSQLDHLVGMGVFAALTDLAVFSQVCIGERGRSLEWPSEIELCADALWFNAHPEDARQRPAGSATHHAAL
jgi:hypothetical protein